MQGTRRQSQRHSVGKGIPLEGMAKKVATHNLKTVASEFKPGGGGFQAAASDFAHMAYLSKHPAQATPAIHKALKGERQDKRQHEKEGTTDPIRTMVQKIGVGRLGGTRVGSGSVASSLAKKGPHAPHVIPGQKIIVKRGSKVVTHLANDTRETAHEEGRAAAAKSLATNLTDIARHPMHANKMVRDERRAARRDRRSGTVDPTREVMTAAAERLAGLILDAEWEIAE